MLTTGVCGERDADSYNAWKSSCTPIVEEDLESIEPEEMTVVVLPMLECPRPIFVSHRWKLKVDEQIDLVYQWQFCRTRHSRVEQRLRDPRWRSALDATGN